jgi:Cys-tRNA(Pro)/Cys-tRNA(Cys) deacylase
MKPAKKTHAMRVLDAKGVPYTATLYDERAEFHAADEAAQILGVPLSAMYRTLVVLREADPRRKPMIVMVPSDTQLDLKALAEAAGEKKLRMATQREAEQLTGMQVGGISVLGLKRPGFEVLIDARARDLETIHISAGERGMELALRTADLVALSGAKYVSLRA